MRGAHAVHMHCACRVQRVQRTCRQQRLLYVLVEVYLVFILGAYSYYDLPEVEVL